MIVLYALGIINSVLEIFKGVGKMGEIGEYNVKRDAAGAGIWILSGVG